MKSKTQLTRRQFVKTSLVTSGAALLTACGRIGSDAPTPTPLTAPNIIKDRNLVIRTAGWPVSAMPTADEITKNPGKQAYADSLQSWLDQNPNVTVENVEGPIWNPVALKAALIDGSAPSYFLSGVVGNWQSDNVRIAFAQGLLADLTPAVVSTGLKSRLKDPFKHTFERTGEISGRAFYFPIDASMNALWYRRDLAQANGATAPTVEWTIEDVRTFLQDMTSRDIKGLGAPWTMPRYLLDAHGFNLLSQLPEPDQPWRWSADFSDPRWGELLTSYRQMVFVDESIMSDRSLTNDVPYRNEFRAGALGSIYTNIMGAFANAAGDTSFAAMAREQNISFGELLGFAHLPRGDGYVDNSVVLGGVCMPGVSSPDLVHKAIDLVNHIFLSDSVDEAKAAAYERTQNLQAVYNNPLPIDGKFEYAGVPGSFADAWGEDVFELVKALQQVPHSVENDLGFYFPTEELGKPDNTTIDGMWQSIAHDKELFDVDQLLRNSQARWNEQAATYPSTVSARNFQAGVENYYADVAASLQENAPEFYAQRFVPWFEEKIRPKLS